VWTLGEMIAGGPPKGAGLIATRPEADIDSVDLTISARREPDFPIRPKLDLQVKSTSIVDDVEEFIQYDLVLEKDNPHDGNATKILARSGAHLGYVPRIYAWHIDQSIDNGDYQASVLEHGPPTDPQARVIVHLTGHVAPVGIGRYLLV
jgi:HIRAN domain